MAGDPCVAAPSGRYVVTALQALGAFILGVAFLACVVFVVVDAFAPDEDDLEPVEQHHIVVTGPEPIDGRARGWVQ